MTIHTRPDEKVFASGAKPGEMVDFPDIERGWGLAFEQTEGKPPMEWMNGAFLRLNEAVRYFMQRGLSEWSATEDYPAGAFVQHSQKMYKSLLANTDVVPGTAAATWDPVVSDASTTTKGMIEIATVTEAKALTDKLRAITPETLAAVLAEVAPNASEIKRGLVQLVSSAEAQGLTNDEKALTPKKLADAFEGGAQNLISSGFQKLPGGLIMQWGAIATNGSVVQNIVFPLTFPVGLIRMVLSPQTGVGQPIFGMGATVTQTNSGVSVNAGTTTGGAPATGGTIGYIAFGA